MPKDDVIEFEGTVVEAERNLQSQAPERSYSDRAAFGKTQNELYQNRAGRPSHDRGFHLRSYKGSHHMETSKRK